MKKKPFTYVLTGALAIGILGAIPAFAAEDDAAQSTETAAAVTGKAAAFGDHRGGGHGHGKFHINEDQLKEKAEEHGIDTTDKDTRELAKEIMEIELKAKAKELGIETEGKENRAIMKEIHQVQLEAKAKELGISTEGKEQKELAQEVKETLLKQKAKELGINTEGKELKELAVEVREAALEKQAKELGIETEGKEPKELKREVFGASILKAAKELGIDIDGKSTKELMEEIRTDYADEAKKLDIFPFNKEKGFFHGGKKGHHGHGKGGSNIEQDSEESVTESEDTL